MKVLQITDTHLSSDPAWTLFGFDVRARYEQVLEHLRTTAPQPELVLVTGDISHDEGMAVYEPFRADMETLGAPVLVIPGNHDVPADFERAFGDGGPVRWQFAHEAVGWRFICLNTQVPGAVEGRLGTGQIDRLDTALADRPDTPTVLCLHHPVVPVGTPWLDAHHVEDADELQQRLARHPQVRLLLSGHVHHATDVELREGIRQLTAPATSAPFKPGSSSLERGDDPPGMRWLDLEPDGTFETVATYVQ